MLDRDRLNLPQRIVLVLALGAALRSVGWWLLEDHDAGGGWTSYAPDAALSYYGTGARFSPFVVTVGRLLLVLAWAVGSVWLLGRSHRGPSA